MTASGGVRSDRIKAYKKAEGTRLPAERDREVLAHLPLVHSVVERIAAHLPASVDKDDLLHAGVIGLIDALNRFDASRDNAFSTYAVLRIRGQVIDELRERDWIPRSARNRAREYHQAVAELSGTLNRIPNDQELAAHLGVDENSLLVLEQESQLATQISLDAPTGDDNQLGSTLSRNDDETANPARNLERQDQRELLGKLLTTLSEQERQIVQMYYFENLLMKEIAAVLGVTESRICQIHSRILALLRVRLGGNESNW
jgi:RNA polymerase sigma factor for flagellar operon FliA